MTLSVHWSTELLQRKRDHSAFTPLPQHTPTSHKLQPLDHRVYDPFKKAVNTVCDSWMLNHPGQTMTIYDIPGIVCKPLPLVKTPRNIISGFPCTGIIPYNPNIFSATDFPNCVFPPRTIDVTHLYRFNFVISASQSLHRIRVALVNLSSSWRFLQT